jgi:hypothetical protein
MMEPIEAPPETRKSGHRWFDIALSVSAILMSASSLYLAQNSSNAMERLVQANSMPFIQLESGNATDDGQPGVLAFSVRNAGTGPARVHSYELLVDGVVVPRRGYVPLNAMRACCPSQLDRALTAANGDLPAMLGNDLTSPIANTFFAPNDEAVAWAWRRSEANTELWSAVDQARQSGRIGMRACYCSLFDECWIAETGVFPPRPVDACTPPAPASNDPD